MSPEALSAAIMAAPEYLPRFTHKAYEKAFSEYRERFGPAWAEAGGACAEEPEAAERLAAEIFAVLEQTWKKARFWNRAALRTGHKQVIVCFLSPMLLLLETPGCRELAVALRDCWTARLPKDAYRIAPYETIKKGFRNAIMGIELPDKREKPDDSI